MNGFLKRSETLITDEKDKPVYLRGVNFGGWLMREAYFLHAPNLPEKFFRKTFTDALGAEAWEEWDKAFNDHFIDSSDFKRVAGWGFNSIRLPFHHRLVESQPFAYDREGLKILKDAVGQAKKNGLRVILDLHAAPGGQNNDWHSDNYGPALLWDNKENQERVFALWEFLAGEFKNEPAVAGYDLLNESVVDDVKVLSAFYKALIKRIRKVDTKHLLFVEANKWAIFPDGLEDIFQEPNTVLSIHNYEPMDVTFNMVPHAKYPLKHYNRSALKRHVEKYRFFSQRHQVPVHVGEFGVNYRAGFCGEDVWLKDVLAEFNRAGFHWHYWTYKAVKNAAFPDGVLSYYPNPPWVHRLGPRMGWETYHLHWPTRKKEMMQSWRTESFDVNKPVLKCLRDAAKNHKPR